MNITLIGMPASGKSTIGKKLAKELGYSFIDIDIEMGRSAGMPYPQFAKKATKNEFLKAEEIEVLKLEGIDNTVIAPGGSVVYSDKAMKHLKEISMVIFLNVSVGEIKRRIEMDVTFRGIVGLKERGIEAIYNERVKLYKKYADVTVDVEKPNVDFAIRRIKEKIN